MHQQQNINKRQWCELINKKTSKEFSEVLLWLEWHCQKSLLSFSSRSFFITVFFYEEPVRMACLIKIKHKSTFLGKMLVSFSYFSFTIRRRQFSWVGWQYVRQLYSLASTFPVMLLCVRTIFIFSAKCDETGRCWYSHLCYSPVNVKMLILISECELKFLVPFLWEWNSTV